MITNETISPNASTAFAYALTYNECHYLKTGMCPIENVNIASIEPLSNFEAYAKNDARYCLQLASMIIHSDSPAAKKMTRLSPLQIYEEADGRQIIANGRHRYCIASKLNTHGANINIPAYVQSVNRPKR